MAVDIGKRFAADADRVRVQIDGETVRVVGATYRLSSSLDHRGTDTWYGPRYEKLGLFGQPNGPTIELARTAKALRFEIKAEEDRRKRELAAAIPAVRPTPALISPGAPTFTSGVSGRWSDLKSQAPPPPPPPPAPFDDEIPFGG
jgi:hypothetical protein